jgi:hypothetical protein
MRLSSLSHLNTHHSRFIVERVKSAYADLMEGRHLSAGVARERGRLVAAVMSTVGG